MLIGKGRGPGGCGGEKAVNLRDGRSAIILFWT